MSEQRKQFEEEQNSSPEQPESSGGLDTETPEFVGDTPFPEAIYEGDPGMDIRKDPEGYLQEINTEPFNIPSIMIGGTKPAGSSESSRISTEDLTRAMDGGVSPYDVINLINRKQ